MPRKMLHVPTGEVVTVPSALFTATESVKGTRPDGRRRTFRGSELQALPAAEAPRTYGHALRTAPAPQTVAEKVAFGLRHAGLHSARAEEARTVTITRDQRLPEHAWMTERAVASLVDAAARIQRVQHSISMQDDSTFVVELGAAL